MKTFKLKFSTIQFSNPNELMDCILHLERIRLTNIDYEDYLKNPPVSEDQLRRNAYNRRFIENSNVQGILPTFQYDNDTCSLDIATYGGLVASMVHSQDEFSENTLYCMGEFFDFMSFFEVHAKSKHPISAMYETYENGQLVSVKHFNVADHKQLF